MVVLLCFLKQLRRDDEKRVTNLHIESEKQQFCTLSMWVFYLCSFREMNCFFLFSARCEYMSTTFQFFFFQFPNHRHQFLFLDSWYTFVRARRLEMNDIWLQKGEVLFSDVVVVVAYPVCAGLSKNKTWGSTIFKTHPRVRENLH